MTSPFSCVVRDEHCRLGHLGDIPTLTDRVLICVIRIDMTERSFGLDHYVQSLGLSNDPAKTER